MFDQRRIDLHVHSTSSDGTFTPSELIDLAVAVDLRAIAITDHDSISGIKEAMNAAALKNLEIIPGVELSCDYNGKEVHMLGYFIDPDNEEFKKHLFHFCEVRDNRNKKMVELLIQEGFSITYENLLAENPDSVITRANIARFLVDHGMVKDLNTVFSKYLGDDCRCAVPRAKITPMKAIELIHRAGGLAFLAHPLIYRLSQEHLTCMIEALKNAGLDGMEAIYSTYQPGDERNMKALAAEFNLLISGGSDFHGTNKPHIRLGTGMGNLYVPYEVLTKIRLKQ